MFNPFKAFAYHINSNQLLNIITTLTKELLVLSILDLTMQVSHLFSRVRHVVETMGNK